MAIYRIDQETSEERERAVSEDEVVSESGDLQGDTVVVFRDCGSNI